MSRRKKSNYSQHTIRTHQTHKSLSRQSKRKRYTKRDRDRNTDSIDHSPHSLYHNVIPPNYRQSSLQIQDLSQHKHTRSQYSHHTHSHSTFHRSNIAHTKQYRNTNEYLPDIQSNDEDSHSEDYNEYKQYRSTNNRTIHRNTPNPHTSSANIEQILKAVRREYQMQVDHVISKWKELLDRATNDVEKYRNIYHSERTHNKKLQQTIEQLRSKLKKYKNKDNENQIIIIDLQRKLNDVYDNLTDITSQTPSQTPIYYSQNMYGRDSLNNKPKMPLVSPRKIMNLRQSNGNDSYYNYGTRLSANNSLKTPLKNSLPPPIEMLLSPKSKRRNSQSNYEVILRINGNGNGNGHGTEEEMNDIQDKIVKTRDDLKKILDTIDDNKHSLHLSSDNHSSLRMCDSNTNVDKFKIISVIIKYKDELFKNKSNTIKVSEGISLNEFVTQLCDSININPHLIQLQHSNTSMIDISNETNVNLSLAELDIHNFDNLFVYIDYGKLLLTQNQNMSHGNTDVIKVFQQCINTNNNAKAMLLLKKSISNQTEYCLGLENSLGLYQIMNECLLENNPKLMLQLLCDKVCKIIHCQHIRLYFKWNNLLQILYPRTNLNIKQQIVVDLNGSDTNHSQSLLLNLINECANETENKETNLINLMQIINDSKQFDSEFNKLFDYKIDSTLLSPLFFTNEQFIDGEFIGIIQLINKENENNNFEFSFNDKQLLLPFANILAQSLKILYHFYSQNTIFDAIHSNDTNANNVNKYSLFSNTRVNRGVSRAIPENEKYNIHYHRKPQSHSVSADDQLNILRHNSISRNASPHIYYNGNDNLSATSSVHSHSTPLFAPMITSPPQMPISVNSNQNSHNGIVHSENKITSVMRQRKRNESEQYHHTFLTNDDSSDHHQQNSIVLNASEHFDMSTKQLMETNHKTRESISHETNNQSSESSNESDSEESNNQSKNDENDELLTPPTPTQNISLM